MMLRAMPLGVPFGFSLRTDSSDSAQNGKWEAHGRDEVDEP